MSGQLEIVGLYRSSKHNYIGHFGRAAGNEPMVALERAEFEAGCGIVGDRFHQADPTRAGQVTFFSEETWLQLRQSLGRTDCGPDVFRRNVLVRGADLNRLIGTIFEIGGVRFEGADYCRPCFWMDQAFAPGTLHLLNQWKAGGLRARVLTGGMLVCSRFSPARRPESALC